jgi:hypothetical protein
MRRFPKLPLPVPKNNARGCLCKDAQTYSRNCCNPNDIWAQGIGSITKDTSEDS